ncbi:MAG: DUF3667 domain-containing protein [Alphaproteobacteria bacterium]|nr:DUF3667 domain-containing protein [Alphaproteobacteria bacterium]
MAVMPECANCGTALSGPYCSNCGQKASDYHRPFWWILGEFLDSVFGYDSRTFRTIWLLFAEPGEFTRRYVAGERASMLPPFRLFVIASVVFFLTLQLTGIAMVAFKMETLSLKDLPPAAAEELKKEKANGMTIVDDEKRTVVSMDFFVPADQIQHVKLTKEQRRTVLAAEDAFKVDAKDADPDEVGWLHWIQTKAKRVQDGYERALADPIKLNGPLNVWLPRLMLFLVPIFALLLAIMHWWPRVFFIEHLVFSTHIHTVVFVALSLLALSAAILGDSGFMGAVWLILAIYLWMAMYRVYGRSWWLTSIKFMALLMVYSVILSVGMGLVFVMALSEV